MRLQYRDYVLGYTRGMYKQNILLPNLLAHIHSPRTRLHTSTVGINTYILILRCFRKSVLNTSLSVRRRNSDAGREMKHQDLRKRDQNGIQKRELISRACLACLRGGRVG